MNVPAFITNRDFTILSEWVSITFQFFHIVEYLTDVEELQVVGDSEPQATMNLK